MALKRISSEERKKIIIRCSIEVFSNSNYRLAKVPEIAQLAGVTEPVVYNHFKTKKKLFLETLSKIGEKTIERSVREIDEIQGNAIKIIESMVMNYLNYMNQYRKELKIYYQAISEIDDEDIRKVLQSTYTDYADYFSKILNAGIRDGEIRKDIDVKSYSWKIVGLLIHLSTFYLLGLYDENFAIKLVEQHIQELM